LIALNTNILTRYLLDDDPAQARKLGVPLPVAAP